MTVPPDVGQTDTWSRPVIVTPLGPSAIALPGTFCRPVPVPPNITGKMILKAASKTGKQFKLFTLRAINSDQIVSREDLKRLIRSQLGDLVWRDFVVGSVNGNKVITIRTHADVSELWCDVKNKSCMLWCDGLRDDHHCKRKRCHGEEGSESDEEIRVEEIGATNKLCSKRKKKMSPGKGKIGCNLACMNLETNMVPVLHQCNIAYGVR